MIRKAVEVKPVNARFRQSRSIAMSSLLLAVLGCSDQESDTGGKITEALARDFEGIYALTARTMNPAACEVGPSTLADTSDPMFVLVATSLLGQQMVELVSCKPDTCADTAAKTKAQTIVGSEYRYTFSGMKSADVLTGFIAWSGRDDGSSTCVERTYDEFTLTRTGEALHLERITKALPDAPAEEGFCFADPDKDQKEAASAPCSEMETLEAARSGDLP